VRRHNRLSALLWLGQGRSPDEVAELLGVCPRTVWLSARKRDPPPGLKSASKMDPPQPHPFQ
jgi:hypothetical protein